MVNRSQTGRTLPRSSSFLVVLWGRRRSLTSREIDVPHHFEFDARHRILLIAMEGDVQGFEIEQMNEKIREKVVSLNPSAGIGDFSSAKTLNVSSDVLRRAAFAPSPYPDSTPRFLVAPTDFFFGMARMYEMIANRPDEKLRVVRTRGDALAALGAPDAKFERLD